MKVNRIIYNILKENTDVAAQVATRIYPLIAPQGVTTPFIISGQMNNRGWGSKDGPATTDIAEADVYVFHENMDTVEDIAELVRLALDRYSGTVASIKVISIKYNTENPDFDFETGWYFKKLNFQIIADR